MDGVHAEAGAKEDQRQDEFLKERKETAELADPQSYQRWFRPVQCQAVPEVEERPPQSVPSGAAEQRSCGAVLRRSRAGSCEKERRLPKAALRDASGKAEQRSCGKRYAD
uniref:Uncharacterized protein n=1 Tax=Sphaerodactylus townsendi TaxID=933632 RepID=A0ACB8F8S2_9SAUR